MIDAPSRRGQAPLGPGPDAKHPESARRLLQLLRDAGGETSADAGRIYGVSPYSWKTWVQGRSPIPEEQAKRVARVHNISPFWVMTGEGPREQAPSVPLGGFIAAGDAFAEFSDLTTTDTISTIVSEDAVMALKVQGESMYPVYRQGDILYLGAPVAPTPEMVGIECAVTLHNGARYVKILGARESGGRWTLTSYNSPPMNGQDVHRVAPIVGVRRYVRRHRFPPTSGTK